MNRVGALNELRHEVQLATSALQSAFLFLQKTDPQDEALAKTYLQNAKKYTDRAVASMSRLRGDE